MNEMEMKKSGLAAVTARKQVGACAGLDFASLGF